MKSRILFFIPGIFLLFFSGVHAQDLQIIQGSKSRTFKVGKLIGVDIPADEGLDACPGKYIIGRLVSYKNEILTLRIRYESECIVKGDKKIGAETKNYIVKKEEDWPVVELPLEKIIAITKQGGKDWESNNRGDIIGGVSTAFGLILLTSAAIAEGEENQDVILGMGITYTAIGVTMIALFDRKTYFIENNLNATNKHKTWDIR